MKKYWIVVLVALLIAVSLPFKVTMRYIVRAGVSYVTYDWKPCSQPNTKWVSEDGTVSFFVHDYQGATGTLSVNGENMNIYIGEGPARSVDMYIHPIDVLKDSAIAENNFYEYWTCSYKSKEKFVATAVDTTFFDVGQKITFYKVSEGGQADG